MKSTAYKSQVLVFNTENEMKNSHLKKSIDPQYRCNICNKMYTTISSLKSHKIRHKDKRERPFDCNFCHYKGASKRDLLRHHDQHLGHARQIHKCDYCQNVFKVKDYLMEHIRSCHTKEIMYKCGQCSFSCYRRSILRNHLKFHDVKVQIICPICKATFKTDSNLKTHLKSHAGVKPFACVECDKSFVVKNRLIRHMQSAHSPKAFECFTCHKKFSNIYLLKRHSLIHSGDRPFKCCFCSYDSNTQGNLVKHVRKIHRLHYFTYKDLLIKQGTVDDPCEGLSKEELQSMIDRGKKTVQSQLKVLHEKGLTEFSYQDLEKVENYKKKLKDDLIKTNAEKKSKSKKFKEQKLKGQTDIEHQENSAANKFPSQAFKNLYRKASQFSLPSGDIANSKINDVIQSENDLTVVDEMNSGNTPTIHVLWNVNYPVNDDSKLLPTHSRKTKSVGKKSKLKVSSANAVKRKALKSRNLSAETQEMCRNANTLNDSHLLEDNELTFTDKPLMQLHEAENFSTGNYSNDLRTPLDNLRTDLAFEEIESPTTVAVTSEENSYIDKVYKNVDLCNQFLHINEDEPHLICTFETVSGSQDENKNVSKLKINSNSTEISSEQHKSHHLNSSKPSQVSLSDEELSNYKVTEDEYSDHSNNEITTEIKELIDAANSMKRDKDKEPEISLIDNDEASNLMITIHSLSNFDSLKCEVDIPKRETEEIILLQENEHGEALPPWLLVNEVSSSQSSKEIVIKNSANNLKLDNEDMVVTSIAEVEEENEAEIVLVIS